MAPDPSGGQRTTGTNGSDVSHCIPSIAYRVSRAQWTWPRLGTAVMSVAIDHGNRNANALKGLYPELSKKGGARLRPPIVRSDPITGSDTVDICSSPRWPRGKSDRVFALVIEICTSLPERSLAAQDLGMATIERNKGGRLELGMSERKRWNKQQGKKPKAMICDQRTSPLPGGAARVFLAIRLTYAVGKGGSLIFVDNHDPPG